MAPTINWIALGKTTEVKTGESVLEAAQNHNIDLQHACGGFCACTTCIVEVISGSDQLSKPEGEELERLESKNVSPQKFRLGCQAKVLGNVTVKFE